MRILYLSYFYPPLGGPAALRSGKTVKYLSRLGWEVDVLTVRDVEYAYFDASLDSHAREVIRVRSLDLMSLLKLLRRGKPGSGRAIYTGTPERIKRIIRGLHPIDDKIGWLPFLLRAGRKKLSTQTYDLIYVTCGPFSAAIGAYLLSREFHVPFVYEARDYWTLLSDYPLQSLSYRLSRYWERKILNAAALIVNATAGITEDTIHSFGEALRPKSITIYNGWDEEDFTGLEPLSPQGFTFAYFGNIYARRSLRSFYLALGILRDSGKLPQDTRVDLYGTFPREVAEEIRDCPVADLIRVIPQVPHREALQAMLSSSVLLLVINSSSPRGTLTSKVFEYLRCKRPILAMVPAKNEAAELLRQCGQDHICAMESPESIMREISRLIDERAAAEGYTIPTQFTRENQVAVLAEKLSELLPLGEA